MNKTSQYNTKSNKLINSGGISKKIVLLFVKTKGKTCHYFVGILDVYNQYYFSYMFVVKVYWLWHCG